MKNLLKYCNKSIFN